MTQNKEKLKSKDYKEGFIDGRIFQLQEDLNPKEVEGECGCKGRIKKGYHSASHCCVYLPCHKPSKEESRCKCACHENKLKKPYLHSDTCCSSMNGYVEQDKPEKKTMSEAK